MSRSLLSLVCAALLIAAPGGARGAARDTLRVGPDSTRTATDAARDTLRVAPDSTRTAADTLAFRLVPAAPGLPPPGGEGQLVEPSGVAADAFGRVWVADAALHRLQRYDAAGRWLGESGTLGSDPGQLRRPGSVALHGTLSVALLDVENRRVVSYDLFGRLLGTVVDFTDPTLESAVGRIDPVAMAGDPSGALFVAETDRERLLVFDSSGRYLRTMGGVGDRPGSFRGLRGVGVTPHGEIVTAERLNARVQRFDPTGQPLASWLLPVRPGRGALAVAAADSGRIAVADEPSGRVWVFDAAGTTLAALGGLARPRALAFAPDGALLVAEAGAGRVVRLKLVPAERLGP